MTNEQREIHRKKRIIEYAERTGNIHKSCRYFGVARPTFDLWRDRYREFGDEGLRSRFEGYLGNLSLTLLRSNTRKRGT
jgi:transposase-like protein